MPRKKILHVTRSPTNRHQWMLRLSCGHNISLVTNKRPHVGGKGVTCPQCQSGHS